MSKGKEADDGILISNSPSDNPKVSLGNDHVNSGTNGDIGLKRPLSTNSEESPPPNLSITTGQKRG